MRSVVVCAHLSSDATLLLTTTICVKIKDIMPRKDAYGGTISAQAQQDLVSEGIENFELPKSLVMKIAKSSVRMSATVHDVRC